MARIFWKPIAALVFTVLTVPALAATYVLQYGINDYPGTDGDLRGCVNDVLKMKELLVSQFGVPAENFKTFTDGQANKDGFISGVKWIVENVKAGDQVIVQYSGHGGQLKTTDVANEPDGFEEVICLADDTQVPGKFFREWAEDMKSKGVNATYVIDSCFSGGMSRPPASLKFMDVTYAVERSAQRSLGDVTERAGAARVSDMELRQLRVGLRGKSRPEVQGSWAFLMAAKEDLPSADLEFKDSTPAHGAFTFILLAALKDMGGHGVKEVVDVVKSVLDKSDLKQGPNSEFSAEQRATLPFVLKG